MIDLKQYEIWFVTGSQHLYGPKTLETVAEHSREIASVLGASASYAGQCGVQTRPDYPRSPSVSCALKQTRPKTALV